MSVNSKMTAIADPIRTLMGSSGKIGLDAMANHLGNAVTEVDNQNGIIQELKAAIAENVSKTSSEVSEQTELIQQIKGAINENVGKTTAEVETQTDLIQQIKTALEGKAGGGGVADPVVEPLEVTENGTYTAPNGVDGYSPVMVNVPIPSGYIKPSGTLEVTKTGKHDVTEYAEVNVNISTSAGMVVKSGTTTSRTINTGLSDVEQFFMYKETQTGTGLIHLHYTKSATSRMYASAWSTNNYGTKTITNGTGGVTVSGGTVTISATQAAQGALTSNVTYKWVAVGTE